jgi:hypothetical protein
MKKIKFGFIALFLQLIVISMPVFAALDYVEYISQTNEGTGYYVIHNSNIAGQTFNTPANCKYIDYIELMIDYNQWSSSEALTLTLYTSTAKTTVVSKATLNGGNAGLYHKFYLKTTVTPNTTYYMELSHDGGGDNSVGWIVASNGNPYSAGYAYTGYATLTAQTDADLYFRILGYENPFLLTAFYIPPAAYTNTTQYDYIRDANFNCIQIYSGNNETQAQNNAILSLCASRGIMVRNNDEDYLTLTKTQIDIAVARYKDHSANGGFFIEDEPSADKFSSCAFAYNAILDTAPTKIPHINLFPIYATNTQLGVSSIACTSQTDEGIGYYVIHNSNVVGQTFDTPADCTYIDYIELMIDYNQWNNSEPLTLTLYTSTAKTAILSQAILNGSNAGLYPRFYLETSVTPNTSYYMELSHGGGYDNSVGWVVASDVNPYLAGCAYTGNTTLVPHLDTDLYFRIYKGRSAKDKSVNQVTEDSGLSISSTQRIGQTFKTPSTLERRLDFIELHIDQLSSWNANENLTITIYDSPSKHQVLGSDTLSGQPIDCLSQINEGIGYYVIHNSNVVGQTFDTPADCTYIDYIELLIDYNQWSSYEPLTLTLYNSTAKTTLIKSVTLNSSNAGLYPRFYLNTSVNPNTSYYMELSHDGGGDNSVGWVAGADTNPYADGCAYTGNTTLTPHLDTDLYFKIYKSHSENQSAYPRFHLTADLKPDTSYFFEVTHDGNGDNNISSIRKSSNDSYSDGTAYINGNATSGDFYFRTAYKNLYQDYINEWVEAVGASNLKYLSYDHYPFYYDGSFSSTYFLNLELVRNIGLQNNVKTTCYIQSIGYASRRIPNENELRYNVYSILAYGMKQLEWFCYFTPPIGNSENLINALIDTDGTKTNLYTPAQTLNGEVKQLGPTLVTLRSQAVYHNGELDTGTQGVPDDFWWQPGTNDRVIISYFKNHDGRKYILVVNKNMTDGATYYFTVSPNPSTVKEISKSTGQEINTNYNSGQLSGYFAPGEGKLYVLPSEY